MKNKPPAILFDLNGTMINDMKYHVSAWYRILNEMGANVTVEKIKEEAYGKNDEFLERIFPGRFTLKEKNEITFEKEKRYQAEFLPHLKLIDGLPEYLEQCYKEGIKMAIGSAAIKFNIDYVIDNLKIRHYFKVLVSAEDVAYSKPDPEVWLICARRLEVPPEECLVFEDAPKGVESAANAGMKAIAITTMHEPPDFGNYSNIIRFIKNYKQMIMSNG